MSMTGSALDTPWRPLFSSPDGSRISPPCEPRRLRIRRPSGSMPTPTTPCRDAMKPEGETVADHRCVQPRRQETALGRAFDQALSAKPGQGFADRRRRKPKAARLVDDDDRLTGHIAPRPRAFTDLVEGEHEGIASSGHIRLLPERRLLAAQTASPISCDAGNEKLAAECRAAPQETADHPPQSGGLGSSCGHGKRKEH